MNNSNLETPCFVINSSKLITLLKNFASSLSKTFRNNIIAYSFKTNNLPWVISFLKDYGFWAEVVSSDEYLLARDLGFETERIVFNGPAKRKAEFIEAVNGGALVNIDSKRELLWLSECDKQKNSKINIGLRVNFCLEDYCPGETQCGNEDGRFGFSYENGELLNAIRYLQSINIPLSGLHMHCSSKTRSLNIYKAIAKVANEIVSSYNLNLKYLDIGGGYFGGVKDKPSFSDYFKAINDEIQNNPLFKDVIIVAEPGISIVGSPIDYVTRVIDVKKTKNNTFVTLDGSRIHIDPLMHKRSYSFDLKLKDSDRPESSIQTLCGFTCMENDRFFKAKLPQLKEGDIIVFEKVGGYTMGLSPQFIEAFPPVYVDADGKLEIVREKQQLPKY